MKSFRLGMLVTVALGVVLFGAQSGPASAATPGAEAGDAPDPAPGGMSAAKTLPAPIHASLGLKRTAGAAVKEMPASGRCPSGQVEVEGDYCPYVEQKCLRWLDPETKMRCAEFAPTTECQSRTLHKHFCIDAFEFPNKVGEKPVIMKSWYEAKAACQAAGKRLCTDSEWTLACEGQERLPYPYGYARNAEACNIDKPHPDVDEKAIANPKTRDAEVARLWQGEPSGTRESCVSPYGVHDMTGNVDEWVVNESGHPYQSGLKGGYWGPVRTRCRPMTTAHNEEFQFYQIGFRCCSEPQPGAGQPAGEGSIGAGKGSGVNPTPMGADTTAAGVLTGS